MREVFFIVFMSLSFVVFAQVGTTQGEYDFCKSKAKAKVIAAPNDCFAVEMFYWKSPINEIEVSFMGIVRYNDNDLRTLIVIIRDSVKRDNFIIVPNEQSKQTLMEDYHDELSKLTKEQLVAFTMAQAEYLHRLPDNYPIAIKEYYLKSRKDKVRPTATFKPSKTNSYASITVGGGLAGRAFTRFKPENNTGFYGTVVIKVCVLKSGKVVDVAYSQRGSTTDNSNLRKLAEDAALKFRFEDNPYAPDKQCGTITFTFTP